MREGAKRGLAWILAAMLMDLAFCGSMLGSGHGPVFGLATPTNPQGGWSVDFNLMGRGGNGSGVMFRPALGYGVTENLKIAFSAPVRLRAEPFVPARMSAFSSMSGDFEGTAIWRFHRQDTGVGSRFESAVLGGVLLPGAQADGGPLRQTRSGAGGLIGGVTGVASRSHYAWAGASYQRYGARGGDRRPDVLFYSGAYAYRPASWRKDSGWDWRIFGELTGERAGAVQLSSVSIAGSKSQQVFLGPSVLGVYKNYAVSAGFQLPVYQGRSTFYPQERFRFALNFAYFF